MPSFTEITAKKKKNILKLEFDFKGIAPGTEECSVVDTNLKAIQI